MKKTLLSAALIATCLSASAQKLNFIPWTENGYLTGTHISDNGKYVAGSDKGGQAFIYNTETGEIKYYADPMIGEETDYSTNSDVRSITNDGTGVGFMAEQPAKYDFATGTSQKISGQNEAEAGLYNYISADGKTMAGMRWNGMFYRAPVININGTEEYLPSPKASWLGWKEYMGCCITAGNSDGSVLMGYILDNYGVQTLGFWTLNDDDKTYSVVPAAKKYYDGSAALDGPQPYDNFSGAAMSSNGKWAVIEYHDKTDYTKGNAIARYDIETDAVEYITCPLADNSIEYYATGISDEGTIVGYIQNKSNFDRKGFIVQGDENEAKLLADVYPDVKEWATLDTNSFNTPCGITPDGRYIVGFGFVDYNETSLCYGTYWFDAEGETSGVSNIKSGKANKVNESFSIDGRKVSTASPMRNNMVINKYDNGEVKKIIK